MLLTGDYPIVDFSLTGKLCCAAMIVVAVGIVAVPASILAGAFVDLLQEQAEERRKQRFEAASNMQVSNKRWVYHILSTTPYYTMPPYILTMPFHFSLSP